MGEVANAAATREGEVASLLRSHQQLTINNQQSTINKQQTTNNNARS